MRSVDPATSCSTPSRRGPCLQAVLDQDTVLSPDLTQEVRWPRWAKQAHAELGVCSILSLLLYTDAGSCGP